jgi:hypothetical protein
LAKLLTSRGLSAEILDPSQAPITSGGLALIRTKNHYLGATYAALFRNAINSAHAIANALNRLYWLPKFGPPFAAISSEDVVEKIELKPPWLLATAWRLGLDSVVTSVEGAKSVIEHRNYMRNPLAKATIVMQKPLEVKRVFAVAGAVDGLAGEALRALGLKYAEVAVGVYGSGEYIVDIDPIPDLDEARAKLLAELVLEEA